MHVEPQKEHKWLERFVGEWTFESECGAAPGQPPMKSKGSEVVRSVGGIWIICEGLGEMPGGGGMGKTIITLGYDTKIKRFMGTFVGSMFTHLWIYNGSLDAAGKVLTLDTEGPDFTSSKLAKYQDIVELVDDNHRILRSQCLGDDGKWVQFMTAHYRRTK